MRFWERPKKEIVKDVEFDEKGNPVSRLRARLFIRKGKLGNYVMQLETKVNDEWKEVVRFNYYHGFAHRDVFTIDGDKFKEDMGRYINVQEAFGSAQKDININWEKYIRRFKGVRK